MSCLPPTDREGVKAFLRRFRAAIPDFRVSVDDLFAEGDRVAWRWTFQGTHQGPFLERPPTGKQVTIAGIHILRFAGGKIQEDWASYDSRGLLDQLGVSSGAGQGRRELRKPALSAMA